MLSEEVTLWLRLVVFQNSEKEENNEKWLPIKIKKHIKNHYGEEEADKFKSSKNWLRRFCSRNGILLRGCKNKKKIGNQDKLPIIQNFHRQLREVVKSRKRHESQDTYHKGGTM